ncbi:hypothetical protein Tco_0770656 [Tanacetum coccineum]|uniref:Uncharacterized protein n=1 Tax=Tanacetum coccineum TaxID=301880 RepID=A0ABQ4ZD34_9ASTR
MVSFYSSDIVSCTMVSVYFLRHCELHNGLILLLRHCELHNGLISFPDIRLSTIIRRLSHKLFRELLPFTQFYSGNIVSRNVLILGISSPFVIVLTLWSLLLGPGAVPTDTTLSNSQTRQAFWFCYKRDREALADKQPLRVSDHKGCYSYRSQSARRNDPVQFWSFSLVLSSSGISLIQLVWSKSILDRGKMCKLRTEGAGGCFGKALSHHNQNVFSFLLKLNLVEDEERS